MEKINMEIVVASLLISGFDQVDALLYTYVLGQLSLDNQDLKLFVFSDEEFSSNFNKYIDYDGVVFRLKDGLSLETNVSPIEEKYLPLEKKLHINKRLCEYLSELDYRIIVLKKLAALYDDGIDNPASFFSVKEKQIIYDIFGIDKLPNKSESVSSSDSYDVFRIMINNYNNKLMDNQDEYARERKTDN